MNAQQFTAIAPLLILASAAMVIMLQIAFYRSVRVSGFLTALTFIVAAISCFAISEILPIYVTPLLKADPIAFLFSGVFCAAGLATSILSIDYMSQRGDEPEEYFLLLILSTLGACVLAYATHVVSLLLGLELLSVALYALIAYPDRTVLPLEAAIKYLVLSGAASATMLFGFALLYAATGTLAFSEFATTLSETATGDGALLVGAAMIFSGLAFKLSLVPFHMWTPDVYEGAPSPVAGYLASVSKAAIFIVVYRWFLEADLFNYPILIEVTGLLAILSMLLGNLLALQQTNIKRILAYSSIAHVGYLTIIFMVAGSSINRSLATEAALYYLIAYTATTLAAFALITIISTNPSGSEKAQLKDVSGMFWRTPLMASMFFVALLSLAGIPLTAGFIGKFYIFNAAASGQHWVLMGALIMGSSIGIYYYLRIIYFMTAKPDLNKTPSYVPSIGWGLKGFCCSLIIIILWLGITPQTLIAYLQSIL